MSDYTLYLGDCLDYMRTMELGSVDAIITDLPYGTTACSWDEIIPFAPMWEGIKRVLQSNGVFITTANQPFTSKLIMSNLDWFKYELIWNKSHATGHLDSRNKPMKNHENIIVFSPNGRTIYNPIITKKPRDKIRTGKLIRANTDIYGKFKAESKRLIPDNYSFPLSVIYCESPYKGGEAGLHPTQKPEKLYRYLIQTYTNPDALVFDMCMGSGTTGVAALQLGRRFIGCEIDPNYFAIAEKRIKQAAAQMLLPLEISA